MPVVRKIRKRGATITVEAYAEVLMVEGGDVYTWANRFTGRIRAATIKAAPTNKRPRWGHYGKPLKDTIVSAHPRFWSNGGDKQRIYGAVGSTAPHAFYVDQGTGVYNGGSPYPAKVLPPWQRGSPSLYESTWIPGGPPGRRVSQVMIRGQRGQGFFERGLDDAFTSMRLRAFQTGVDPRLSEVLGSVPSDLLANLPSNGNQAGFQASLDEWRSWRDAAWHDHEGLGRGGGVGSKAHATAIAKAAQQRQARNSIKSVLAKPVRTPKTAKPHPVPKAERTLAEKRARALEQFKAQNPSVQVLSTTNPNGLVVQTVKGPYVIPWSRVLRLVD